MNSRTLSTGWREARAKSKPKAGLTTKENRSKGKKVIAQKHPSKRSLKSKTIDSESSSSSEEEQGVIPLLVKRKRSSEVNRAVLSPTTRPSSTPTTNISFVKAAQTGGPAPSLALTGGHPPSLMRMIILQSKN